MNMPISDALENYLQSDWTEDIHVFLIVLWGVWVCFIAGQLETVKSFQKQINRLSVWSYGIFTPLMLSILLPLALGNTFLRGHTQQITRYVIPIITFFLGDFAARRRSRNEKIKAYRKALISMREEAKENMMFLEDSFHHLAIETNELQNCDDEHAPFRSTFPCESRFLEVFLNNVQCSWRTDSLYNDASSVFNLLKAVNLCFARREEIIELLDSPQTMQQFKAAYVEKLVLNNRTAFGYAYTLSSQLDEMRVRIDTTLSKKPTQFLELIEF